jgi:hypothetical protein
MQWMDFPKQNAWSGPTTFQGGVTPSPGAGFYNYTQQQNQLGQQQMAYANSPLYASLMASMMGPQASMQNNQYSNDTAYNIAEGNAWNERELQKMRNEIAKYVAELENKSRVDVAGIGADASKYGADKSSQAQLGSAWYGADASKYGSDKGYQATAYGADRGLEGLKYTQDAGKENTRYSADTQRAIAETQAEASKYAPGLQQQRFNALLPMMMQLFQANMNRVNKSGTPYLGTMG